MAELKLKIKVDSEFTLILNEEEARALYTITTYGTEEFLKFFYQYLGSSYLEKHEKGLRTLFAEVREKFPGHFHTIGLIDSKLHNT